MRLRRELSDASRTRIAGHRRSLRFGLGTLFVLLTVDCLGLDTRLARVVLPLNRNLCC